MTNPVLNHPSVQGARLTSFEAQKTSYRSLTDPSISTLASQQASKSPEQSGNCFTSFFGAIWRGIAHFFSLLFCCGTKESKEEKNTVFEPKKRPLDYLLQMDNPSSSAIHYIYDPFIEEMSPELRKDFEEEIQGLKADIDPAIRDSQQTHDLLLEEARQSLITKYKIRELEPLKAALEAGNKEEVLKACKALTPSFRKEILHHYFHKGSEKALGSCD